LQINKLAAGFSAALLSLVLVGGTAEASCRDKGTCPQHQAVKKKAFKRSQAGVHKPKSTRTASRKLSGKRYRSQSALAVVPRDHGNVVAMIKASAPHYGVPTWFALRIAQIESGYNPRARGAAGEIGVFQLKCQTARGMGYSGSCGGLYNAATNVQYGLKHLSLAVRSSRGNLRLAASKHNGGLGRKTIVRKYVARVF
jgi:soluble lytic murein transglycosylase-like protein